MRYELTDLRVFMAIANAKSLTAGAMDMHITAPSASYRLKNIEDAMGTALFDRTSKGMRLTAAGEAVYRHAQTVLTNLDRLDGEMERYRSGMTGHIRIFANSSTINSVPTPLSRFLAAHPNVNVDLEEHLSEETVRAVSEGLTDLGLVAGIIHARGLESIEYGQDELVLATPLNHPLATHPRVSIDIALQHPLVSVGRQSSNFLYLQKVAHGMNLRPLVRVHLPDFDAALRCVQQGVGILLAPLSIMKQHADRGTICIVRVDEQWATRRQMVVARSFKTLPAHTRALVQFITTQNETSSAAPSPSIGPQ